MCAILLAPLCTSSTLLHRRSELELVGCAQLEEQRGVFVTCGRGVE
jgi:hypothetical protein